MGKLALVAVCLALLVCSAVGESAMDKLKAKVSAAPCDKAPAGPAPPRQFLDQRLPLVVDDYHPPVGGFDPTDIPSKEVDVAARKILREIQAAEAEAKANGDPVPGAKPDENGILTTEEHKALKQLLLDADILVRAASKSLADNGPIEQEEVKKVAKSAVKKAAKAEKKAKKPKKAKGKKAKKPTAKKPKAKKPKAKKPKAKPAKKAAPKKSSPKPKPAAKKPKKARKGKGKKKGRKGKGKKKGKKGKKKDKKKDKKKKEE